VTPRVALTLALGLHELTTNASKYGALSVPGGHIDVRWRIERSAAQPPLLWFEWRRRRAEGRGAETAGLRDALHKGSVASELQRPSQAGLTIPPAWSAVKSRSTGRAGHRRQRIGLRRWPPR